MTSTYGPRRCPSIIESPSGTAMKWPTVPGVVIQVDTLPPIVVPSREHVARLTAAGSGGPAAPIVLDVPGLKPTRAQPLGARDHET